LFWIFIIQFSILVLPLVFFFIYKRKNKEKIVRVIFYYIVYSLVQEIVTFIVSLYSVQYGWITAHLYTTYTLVEFSLFCLFYYYLFPQGHKAQKIIKVVWPLFIIFAIIDYYFINKHLRFGSYVLAVESILILLLCGYYLYYQITTTLTMFVYRTFNFWIIVTFLLFISATFFLYLMTDTMGKNPVFQKYYFIINFGANLIKNLLLCFALSRKHVIVPGEIEKESDFNLDLGDNEIVLQKNI